MRTQPHIDAHERVHAKNMSDNTSEFSFSFDDYDLESVTGSLVLDNQSIDINSETGSVKAKTRIISPAEAKKQYKTLWGQCNPSEKRAIKEIVNRHPNPNTDFGILDSTEKLLIIGKYGTYLEKKYLEEVVYFRKYTGTFVKPISLSESTVESSSSSKNTGSSETKPTESSSSDQTGIPTGSSETKPTESSSSDQTGILTGSKYHSIKNPDEEAIEKEKKRLEALDKSTRRGYRYKIGDLLHMHYNDKKFGAQWFKIKIVAFKSNNKYEFEWCGFEGYGNEIKSEKHISDIQRRFQKWSEYSKEHPEEKYDMKKTYDNKKRKLN